MVLSVIGIGGFGSGFITLVVATVIFERITKLVLTLNTSLRRTLIPSGNFFDGLLTITIGLYAALIGTEI